MVLPTPTFITSENQYNFTSDPQSDYQTVTLSDGTAVSVYRVPNGDIKVQSLDELGNEVVFERNLVPTDNIMAFSFDIVALDGNQLAVAFTQDGGGIEVMSVVFDNGIIVADGDVAQTFSPASGSAISSPQLSGTNAANLTLHFLNTTGSAVALEEHRDVTGGTFSASTSTAIDAIGASATDAVILANGNRVVVVDTNGGNSSADNVIAFHIIAPNGTFVTSGVTASSSQTDVLEPQVVALSDGAFAIAYRGVDADSDVFFDIYEADGTLRIGSVNAAIDGNNDVHRAPFMVPLEDGGFIVLFNTNASDAEGRRFDANGAPVGDQFVIDSTDTFAPKATLLTEGLVMISFIEDGQLTNRVVVTEAIDFTVSANGILREGDEDDNLLLGLGTDDTLHGFGGDDTLLGGLGDDSLEGGLGADVLDGGDDTDVLSYSTSSAAVNVFLSFDNVSGGDAQGDIISNFENIVGSDFDDRLSGDASDNQLSGGDGDDIIKSKGGSDTLIGGDGGDKLVGSNDQDFIFGDEGNDVVQGFDGEDSIELGSGDDFAIAGRGNDLVFGEEGDDKINGNRGRDFIDGGNGEDDLRGGSGSDSLVGGADKDFITGEGGGDFLFGGAGNDVLRGGFIGAADGNVDTFIFVNNGAGSTGGGFDRVKDFEDGIDRLAISADGVATFADIFALSSDLAGGVKIGFGNGNSFYIENFALADFDETDVTFDVFAG